MLQAYLDVESYEDEETEEHPLLRLVNEALEDHQVERLKFLLSTERSDPERSDPERVFEDEYELTKIVKEAAELGYLDQLQLVVEHFSPFTRLLSAEEREDHRVDVLSQALDEAVRNVHLDCVEWLYSIGAIVDSGTEISKKCDELLQNTREYDINDPRDWERLCRLGADRWDSTLAAAVAWAPSYGYTDPQSGEQKTLSDSSKGVKRTIEEQRAVIDFLLNVGCVITTDTFKDAVSIDNIRVVKYLAEKVATSTQAGWLTNGLLVKAVRDNADRCLQFFLSQYESRCHAKEAVLHIPPGFVRNALKYHQFSSVMLLYTYGYPVESTDLSYLESFLQHGKLDLDDLTYRSRLFTATIDAVACPLLYALVEEKKQSIEDAKERSKVLYEVYDIPTDVVEFGVWKYL